MVVQIKSKPSENLTDPVEPGTSQQGGNMHDYDNEVTQSESGGSDIEERLGFSEKRVAH